jgi:hypothetical protein
VPSEMVTNAVTRLLVPPGPAHVNE